ncbi:MAG: hypothetical protein LBC19_08170 [Tannerella sp.]|jgi:hypothetical protein|nr:hypothetical protein [Tannerella sp.]
MKQFKHFVIIGLLITVSAAGRAETSTPLTVRDASALDWKLWGYRPNVWRMNFVFEYVEEPAASSRRPCHRPRKLQKRFPRCGGFLIWMGHDCFPCPTNNSIIDFEGNPKLAALEISKIWKTQQF